MQTFVSEAEDDRRLLSSIIDTLPQAVVVLDEDGTVLVTNEKWRSCARSHKKDVLRNQRVGDRYIERCKAGPVLAKSAKDIVRGINSLLKGQSEEFDIDYCEEAPGGKKLWTSVVASVFDEPRRCIVILFITTTCKAERHEIKKEMDLLRTEAETTRRFRLAVDSALEAVIMTDRDRHIIYVNRAWQRLTGYSSKEAIGRHPSMLSTKKTPEAERKKMREAIVHGKPYISDQIVNRRKDGSEYAASLMFYPILILRKPQFFVGIQSDISKQKADEDVKSQLIMMVAHQLQTPIAELKGYLENMLGGVVGGFEPKQMQYVQEAHGVCMNAYRLIRDLLSVSRIERQVLAVAFKDVAVGGVVHDAIKPFSVLAAEKGLDVQLRGDAETLIHVDPRICAEAIGNIFHNAVKNTDKGRITITMTSDATNAYIAIRDTGRGIEANRLAQIFQHSNLLQGEPVGGEGASLGLFIAKNFARVQKGDLTATSTPGKGSTFTFQFLLSRYHSC